MEERYTVKQARRLAGKTQLQVANAIGVCLQTYRRLEENPEKMTVAQAKMFCNEVALPKDKVSFCPGF